MVVLITGCSSGIGLRTAVYLAEQGMTVVASMRNLKKKEKLMNALQQKGVEADLLELDVTKSDSIKNAVEELIQRHGRIDALVNNAGITIDGFFEDLSEADIEKIFRTNVFGVFNMTRAVLPHMRKQESGTIVNIGSIAGQWALPQIGIYSSTKFAIEGFTEALRYEVAPFGIHVAVIEPCFVNTEMIHEKRNVGEYSHDSNSPYAKWNEHCEAFYDEYGEKFSVEPVEVSKAVYKVLSQRDPKLRYMLGRRENALRTIKGVLPRRWFEYILHKSFPNLKK